MIQVKIEKTMPNFISPFFNIFLWHLAITVQLDEIKWSNSNELLVTMATTWEPLSYRMWNLQLF